MASSKLKVDKQFLLSVIILIVAAFSSLVLHHLDSWPRTTLNTLRWHSLKLSWASVLGSLAMFLVAKRDYRVLRKYALPLLVIAMILNILVVSLVSASSTEVPDAGLSLEVYPSSHQSS
jgi:peptidoglycan/LPS O-acetylase OafA/YrhL